MKNIILFIIIIPILSCSPSIFLKKYNMTHDEERHIKNIFGETTYNSVVCNIYEYNGEFMQVNTALAWYEPELNIIKMNMFKIKEARYQYALIHEVAHYYQSNAKGYKFYTKESDYSFDPSILMGNINYEQEATAIKNYSMWTDKQMIIYESDYKYYNYFLNKFFNTNKDYMRR